MKLILVENEEEVRVLADKLGNTTDFFWVALAPFAIPELEKLNLHFEVIDKYFSKKELWDATGYNTYNRVSDLIAFVDNFIKKNIKEIGDINILHCYKHQLLLLFDGIIYRLFALDSLIRKLEPVSIFICCRKSESFSSRDYLFSLNDTLWVKCLSLPEWNNIKINLITYHLLQRDNPEIKRRKAFKEVIKQIPMFYKLVKSVRICRKFGWKSFVKPFTNNKKIILIPPEYEWSSTIPIFLKNGFYFDFIDLLDYKGMKKYSMCITNVIEKLKKERYYKDKFSFHQYNFYSILNPIIEKMLLDGLTRSFYIQKKIRKIIKKNTPRAILFSAISNPDYWLWVQFFKKSKIPIICWQHGSQSFYEGRGTAETELLYTDYYFTYGPDVTEAYNQLKSEYNFRSVNIGSSTIDVLKDIKGSEKYILYATTNYYQNHLYFGIYPPFSDIDLYYVQKKILNFLGSLKNERIIFKLHPNVSFRIYPDLILKKNNIEVIRTEKSFIELLPDAKLIILDWPSTTLLQAAATRKPIFVLTNFSKLKPEALILLRRRAVCGETVEQLIEALNFYLKHGIYPSDVHDREFLKMYGTYFDDGKSAERAFNKILEIIKNNG